LKKFLLRKLPKGPNTEFLKRSLKEEWENEKSRNRTWDAKIRDFIK